MSLTFLRQDQNTKDKYYLITENTVLNQVYFTIDSDDINAVEQHFQKLVNDLKEEYQEFLEDMPRKDAIDIIMSYDYVRHGFYFSSDIDDNNLRLQLTLCPDFELDPSWGVYFQLDKQLAQELIELDQIKDVVSDCSEKTDQQIAILKSVLNQEFSEYFINFLKDDSNEIK